MIFLLDVWTWVLECFALINLKNVLLNRYLEIWLKWPIHNYSLHSIRSNFSCLQKLSESILVKFFYAIFSAVSLIANVLKHMDTLLRTYVIALQDFWIQKPLYEVTFESSEKSWSDSDFLLCCGNLTLSVTWGSAFNVGKTACGQQCHFLIEVLFSFQNMTYFFASHWKYIYHLSQTQREMHSIGNKVWCHPKVTDTLVHRCFSEHTTHTYTWFFKINFSFLRQVLFM